MKKADAVYHACRLCFNAGTDGIPWYIILHALRQGLDCKCDFELTAAAFKKHPELKELIQYLNCTKSLL